MAMRMLTTVAVVLVAVNLLAARGAAQSPNTPNCAAKLVPCGQYMNGTDTPPDTCCGPLKDAVKNDLKCLCALYASPEIFKAFNINLTDALRLSKRCGISDTTSNCPSISPTKSPPGSSLQLFSICYQVKVHFYSSSEEFDYFLVPGFVIWRWIRLFVPEDAAAATAL